MSTFEKRLRIAADTNVGLLLIGMIFLLLLNDPLMALVAFCLGLPFGVFAVIGFFFRDKP